MQRSQSNNLLQLADYVASIITQGGPAFGKSGYMPSFKGTLSPDDIADVIAYVRSLSRN